MNDFAAIDFETANAHRSSVCSVGIVIVEGGRITDTFYSLIRPIPDFYSYYNTAVHGLGPHDTASAPTFPEVWHHIAPRLKSLPLVAHNCAFDQGCLRAAFEAYGMPYPDYTFHCTYRTARKKLGKLLPNHRLDTVAAYCGFDLKAHHNALADAEACARIALSLL